MVACRSCTSVWPLTGATIGSVGRIVLVRPYVLGCEMGSELSGSEKPCPVEGRQCRASPLETRLARAGWSLRPSALQLRQREVRCELATAEPDWLSVAA